MVECFCLSMMEVQERGLRAFFQFDNSVTLKGHFGQEKSPSKEYRTFKRKPHKVLGGWSRQFSQEREENFNFNFRTRTVTFVYQ